MNYDMQEQRPVRMVRVYRAITTEGIVFVATTDFNRAWEVLDARGYGIRTIHGIQSIVGKNTWSDTLSPVWQDPAKDWYEALAEGLHFLFGYQWPDWCSDEEMAAAEVWADRRAIRPECERDGYVSK